MVRMSHKFLKGGSRGDYLGDFYQGVNLDYGWEGSSQS